METIALFSILLNIVLVTNLIIQIYKRRCLQEDLRINTNRLTYAN